MVCVVPWLPEKYVPKQAEICHENFIRLGPHIPTLLEHDIRPTAPHPWDVVQEEVTGHVLQSCVRNFCQNFLGPMVTLWIYDVRVEVPYHHEFFPAGSVPWPQLRAQWSRRCLGPGSIPK